MTVHDFIFSDIRRYRIYRHLFFWMGWFLFSGIVQISNFGGFYKDPLTHIGGIISFQFVRSLARFSSILIFCYLIVYFLAPQFFRKQKFVQFGLLFFMCVISMYLLTYGSLYFWLEVARINPYINHWPPWLYFFNSFYSNINFTGAIPTCCLMLAIKYYKDWYAKQHRSAQLARENIQAELQLLKAQVHPHFLFNTLNNIYSFVLTKDNRAAGLVDKLSGMIDYMRIEGQNSFVPLEKEIQLVNDYLGLERVRYGDRLDLQTEITGNPGNKMIAPLLLIPFVENCFKHGASIMRGQQWINLKIDIKNDQLDFQLSNSKPVENIKGTKKGIGLVNVQKRLQLLYPEKFYLKTETTDNTFSVHLQVDLIGENSDDARNVLKPTPQPLAYA